MSNLAGYDAAYPPGTPPAGDTVVLGYLGGDTPHAWTKGEWDTQPARYRIGIWTRSNPTGSGQGNAEGIAAAAAWQALGATPGSLIGLDFETAINGPYVTAFDAAVTAAGFKVALYGSTSTLFQNPKPSGGYWPADLTGIPHLYPGTLLTQYAFESAWDDDTISAAAVLWDTAAISGDDNMAWTQDDINALVDALVPAVRDAILNRQLGRQGADETGNTTLGGMAAWNDEHVVQITRAIGAVGSKVDALAVALAAAVTQESTELEAITAEIGQTHVDVDAAELATSLAGNSAFTNAIAAAVVAQIGADLKSAATG